MVDTANTDALTNSSQQLVPLALTPKAQILKDLLETIPTNDYGLPEYLYRADLLDMDESATTQDNAIMMLDYSQGFASLPNGDSLWLQLPYEDPIAYSAFKAYLEMPRSADPNLSAPVRQLNILKPLTGKSSTELLSWSYMFYWPQRARSYDLFLIASHTKAKEHRMAHVEDSHYNRAQKYIEFAEAHLQDVFSDPEAHDLSPKEAFDMMFKMMQIQRLSVGLSPNGAHANKDVNAMPVNASMEMILRTVAKNAGIIGADNKAATNLTQQLFQDPDSLVQAQELIIKMSNMKNPREQKQGDFMDETP